MDRFTTSRNRDHDFSTRMRAFKRTKIKLPFLINGVIKLTFTGNTKVARTMDMDALMAGAHIFKYTGGIAVKINNIEWVTLVYDGAFVI